MTKSQSVRRLGLAVADALDARADDFGDEGGRIEPECEPKRHQLWDHHNATDEVETLQHRHFQSKRDAGDEKGQERQADDEPETGKEHRELFTRCHLALLGPPANEKGRDDAEQENDIDRVE